MIEDMNKYTKGVRERQAELDVKQVAEAMNEPTLTCSEVVERLLNEAYQPNGNYHESEFDTEIAEKILQEWREQIRKGANHEGA